MTGLFFAALVGISLVMTLIYLPTHLLIFLVFATALLVVVLNTQFYFFLIAKRGKLFALAALPFHLLFLFYSRLSFLIGTVRFGWRTVAGRKTVAVKTRPQP